MQGSRGEIRKGSWRTRRVAVRDPAGNKTRSWQGSVRVEAPPSTPPRGPAPTVRGGPSLHHDTTSLTVRGGPPPHHDTTSLSVRRGNPPARLTTRPPPPGHLPTGQKAPPPGTRPRAAGPDRPAPARHLSGSERAPRGPSAPMAGAQARARGAQSPTRAPGAATLRGRRRRRRQGRGRPGGNDDDRPIRGYLPRRPWSNTFFCHFSSANGRV